MKVLIAILGVLLFSPLTVLTEKIPALELKEGIDQYHTIESPNKDTRNLKFFSFYLDKVKKDANLVVQVRSEDPKSDPDIFIFKNSKEDQSKLAEALVICEIVGGEVCILQEEQHIGKSTYPITVACTGNCSFSIRIDYINAQFLNLASKRENENEIRETVELGKTNATVRLLRVQMPKKSDYDRLNIETTANFENLWVEDSVAALLTFLNKGNKVPSSSEYDKKGKSMWNEVGEIISLSKNAKTFVEKDLFCLGCNYTITVLTQEDYSVKLELYSGSKNKSLPFDNTVKDIVDSDDVNTYFTTLSREAFTNQTEVLIEVFVYTGKLTLYVNSETVPDDLEESLYSSVIEESETFVMTNQELVKNKMIGKKLYISVEGKKEAAVFTLWFTFSEQSNYLTLSSTNNWRGGKVMSREVIQYYLSLFQLNADVTIKFDMVRNSAGSEVYLKKCCGNEPYVLEMNCRFTPDDLKADAAESDLRKLGNKEVLHETYFIKNDPPLNSSCYYTLGIYGNSSSDSKFRFVISTEEKKSIVELFERQVHRSHVTSSLDYYKFHLVSDEDVGSVSFITNAEIGSIKVWISRRTLYPNRTNYERFSELHSSQMEFEKNLELSLQGTYYIAVQSKGNTYYSITPIVGRSHETFSNKRLFTVKLTEGFLERIDYVGNDRLFLFEFNTGGSIGSIFENLFEEYEVYLWVENIIGSYTVYISGNGQCPSEESYQYKFQDSFIRIKRWENTGHYCALVLPNDIKEKEGGSHKHSYTIQYLTPRGVRLIAPGTVVESSAGPKASENFKFSLNPEKEWELIINLRESKGARFILTITPDLGDGLVGKEYLLTEDVLAVNITKETVKSKCEYSWQQCFFFASIKPEYSDTKKVNFTILLKEILDLPHPIRVYEGKLFSYPNLQGKMFFYADIDSKQASTVQFFSQDGYFDIYITIQPSSVNQTEIMRGLVDRETVDNTIRLFGHSSSTYTFKPWENFAKQPCLNSSNCLMAIMVERLFSFDATVYGVFSIYFTNKVSLIAPGTSIHSFIEDGTVEYFEFNVGDAGIERIKIDVNIFDGVAPDIFVSRSRNARPNEFEFDWSSIGGMHEENQLIINRTNYFYPSFEGPYVIGLYGKSNCSFLLSVSFGDDKDLKKLSRGKPETVVQEVNSTAYFEFILRYELPARILIVSSEGKPLVEVASNVTGNSDFLKIEAFSSKQPKWFNRNKSNVIIINPKDKGYCFNCSYIIKAYCQDRCVYDLYAAASNDVLMLKDRHSINDFVQAKKPNIYIYDFKKADSESFKIDVTTISGLGVVSVDVKEMLKNVNSTHVNKYVRRYPIANTLHLEYDVYDPEQKQILVIYVNSTKDTEYQLVLRSGEETHVRLRPGLIEYATLKKSESIDFLYMPRDVGDFSITLKDNDNQSDKYAKSSHFLNVEVKLQVDENEEEKQAKILKVFEFRGVYLYRIAGSLGKFRINVQLNIQGSPDDLEVHQIGVMVNQGAFTLLSPRSPLIEIVQNQKTSFYELVTSQKRTGSTLLVEVFECTGRMAFTTSDSYEGLLNASLQNQLAPYREKKYMAWKGRLPRDRSAHYFSVKPIEGGKQKPASLVLIEEDKNKTKANFPFKEAGKNKTPANSPFIDEDKNKTMEENEDAEDEQEEGVFIIQATILPPDAFVPYDKFIPGNDGKIEWSITSEGGIEVNFQRLRCTEPKCSAYSPKHFSYTLFISTDEADLDSLAQCSIPYYNRKSEAIKSRSWVILGEFPNDWSRLSKVRHSYTIKNSDIQDLIHDNKNPEYFINIVSEVQILENDDVAYSQSYKFVYNREKVLFIYSKSDGIWAKLALFLIIFVVLLSLISLWFYRRYKLIQKKLRYEMQDIRNVAGTLRFSENKTMETSGIQESSILLNVK